MEQYLTCKRCGKEFTHWNSYKSYCDECIVEKDRERQRKRYASKHRKPKPSVERKSISDVLKEMKAYNEAHGTCLSYGQYVLIKEKGD